MSLLLNKRIYKLKFPDYKINIKTMEHSHLPYNNNN